MKEVKEQKGGGRGALAALVILFVMMWAATIKTRTPEVNEFERFARQTELGNLQMLKDLCSPKDQDSCRKYEELKRKMDEEPQK